MGVGDILPPQLARHVESLYETLLGMEFVRVSIEAATNASASTLEYLAQYTRPWWRDSYWSQLGVMGQHCRTLGSIVLAFLLIFGSSLFGWVVLWHFTLKDIGFFREIMGLNREKQQEARRIKEEETRKLKEEHSRRSFRRPLVSPSAIQKRPQGSPSEGPSCRPRQGTTSG